MLPLFLTMVEPEDRRAYITRFYHKHNRDFIRYARTLLGDPALAEDAVQDSWVKCMRYADAFFAVEPENRKAWMIVLLKRVCFTTLRQRSRTVPLAEDWDPPAPEAGEPQCVVDLIRAMPQQYRHILELKFVLEWSDKAIAQAVGLPVTAVSGRIKRGRRILQEQLIREGQITPEKQ